MANLPVDSMREGGLWWFTDLTMADPYCLLPLLTSVTLWITMEVYLRLQKLFIVHKSDRFD